MVVKRQNLGPWTERILKASRQQDRTESQPLIPEAETAEKLKEQNKNLKQKYESASSGLVSLWSRFSSFLASFSRKKQPESLSQINQDKNSVKSPISSEKQSPQLQNQGFSDSQTEQIRPPRMRLKTVVQAFRFLLRTQPAISNGEDLLGGVVSEEIQGLRSTMLGSTHSIASVKPDKMKLYGIDETSSSTDSPNNAKPVYDFSGGDLLIIKSRKSPTKTPPTTCKPISYLQLQPTRGIDITI